MFFNIPASIGDFISSREPMLLAILSIKAGFAIYFLPKVVNLITSFSKRMAKKPMVFVASIFMLQALGFMILSPVVLLVFGAGAGTTAAITTYILGLVLFAGAVISVAYQALIIDGREDQAYPA